MANNVISTSGAWYDPYSYANEMLIWLRNSLGMAARVYRGFDKAPNERGSVIQLRRPQVMAAEAMPAAAADVTPDYVTITLNQWWGKTITLSDKEIAFTKEQVFNDYIQPMAYAIANKIDATLAILYQDIPWTVVNTSPCAVADITALQRVLFANGVPEDNMRHLMLSGVQREEFLNLSAFSQWQGAGAAGQETQLNGSLGMKYGFETFANQNVQAHTAGTATDVAGTASGTNALGATTLNVAAYEASGTVRAGDTLVIAGNTQRYAVTATATASGGAIAILITPPLVAAASSNEVVNVTLVGGSASTTSEQGIGFHRDAFALAMGVLPDNIPGINVFTATDPVTGLSIRARHWAVGLTAQQYLGVDALWGVKTLNPNMACRLVN
jgi:hypothetical protein